MDFFFNFDFLFNNCLLPFMFKLFLLRFFSYWGGWRVSKKFEVYARLWSDLFNLLASEFNFKAVFFHQVDCCNQNLGRILNQSLADALRLVLCWWHGWILIFMLWCGLNRLLRWLHEIQVQQRFNLRLVVFDYVYTSVPFFLRIHSLFRCELGSFNCFEECEDSKYVCCHQVMVAL